MYKAQQAGGQAEKTASDKEDSSDSSDNVEDVDFEEVKD